MASVRLAGRAGSEPGHPRRHESRSGSGSRRVLIAVGAGVAARRRRTGSTPAATIDHWWPVEVIALGRVAAVRRRPAAELSDRRYWSSSAVCCSSDQLDLVAVDAIVGPPSRSGRPWLLFNHGRLSRERDAGRATRPGRRRPARRGRCRGTARPTSWHANVSAVFGGATLDMRDAHAATRGRPWTPSPCSAASTCIVPPGWRVELERPPHLRRRTRTRPPVTATSGPDAPVLKVAATAIFGGGDREEQAGLEPHACSGRGHMQRSRCRSLISVTNGPIGTASRR